MHFIWDHFIKTDVLWNDTIFNIYTSGICNYLLSTEHTANTLWSLNLYWIHTFIPLRKAVIVFKLRSFNCEISRTGCVFSMLWEGSSVCTVRALLTWIDEVQSATSSFIWRVHTWFAGAHHWIFQCIYITYWAVFSTAQACCIHPNCFILGFFSFFLPVVLGQTLFFAGVGSLKLCGLCHSTIK